MIIGNQREVTEAVLAELQGAADPRFRELMQALVRHLHAFAREVHLTEAEFQRAIGYVAALGQRTTPSHNEVALISGSLGLSTLVCLLNNGDDGQTETSANLLGPFWREDAPRTENGGSLLRSATAGPTLYVNAWFRDRAGHPIADAEVDVWHAAPTGLYENQDAGQADMNLRGRFTSDAQGHVWFRTVRPKGYPIPVDGPTGELLAAQGRHNMRPAHMHFIAYKRGFKTLVSQLYDASDPHVDDDVQFGVTRALICDYVRHDAPAPDVEVTAPWYSLDYVFVMEPGEARWPRAPISGKARAG